MKNRRVSRMNDAIKRIEKELDTLKQEELHEIMEYLFKKIVKNQYVRKKSVDSFYGVLKEYLDSDEDAQLYVNELRKE